jgi:uncharacterized protein YbaR (Trm112 family)
VKLKQKDVWWHISQPGDYAWEECCEQRLILACPFCGSDAPVPYTVTVEQKEPLTIVEELHCGFCEAAFEIRDGEAIKHERAQADSPMSPLQVESIPNG